MLTFPWFLTVFCPPSCLHLHTPQPHPALTGRASTTSLDPESAVTWASSHSISQLISFKHRHTKWRQCFRVDLSLTYLYLCSVKKKVSRLCWGGSGNGSIILFFFLNLFLHLQPIFDWNVKQLFLYLSAEYATKSNVSHHTHTGHRFPKISVQLKINRTKTCISVQIWEQKLVAVVPDWAKLHLTIKLQDGATECFCSHIFFCVVWPSFVICSACGLMETLRVC